MNFEITAAEVVTALVALMICVGYIAFQHIRITYYQIQVQAYQTEIATLQQQSIAAADRMEKAVDAAAAQVHAINANSDKILQSNVSPDCSKAVQWAAQQASNFR